MQRHTETKKRWLRLFKKHGSDQWQCLISCEWAQTLRSKYISLSVCLCDPHVLSASDSELECSCSSHGGRCWVAMRGKRAESEEFSQTERGMTNAQTHREREGGREGRSRSCWSSLLLLPPSPPASCRRCVPCSVRPLWEGLRHCAAAPSCIVWVGECVGCRELSQALCCQRMEPCISVPTHSPFLSFTAGSFLRPNTLSLSPHVWNLNYPYWPITTAREEAHAEI